MKYLIDKAKKEFYQAYKGILSDKVLDASWEYQEGKYKDFAREIIEGMPYPCFP